MSLCRRRGLRCVDRSLPFGGSTLDKSPRRGGRLRKSIINLQCGLVYIEGRNSGAPFRSLRVLESSADASQSSLPTPSICALGTMVFRRITDHLRARGEATPQPAELTRVPRAFTTRSFRFPVELSSLKQCSHDKCEFNLATRVLCGEVVGQQRCADPLRQLPSAFRTQPRRVLVGLAWRRPPPCSAAANDLWQALL
jgi:hypothetical protein